MRILSPKSDVFQVCQDFRDSCMNHVREDDDENPEPARQAALDAFRQHLQKAKDERDFYRHGCLFTQQFLEKLADRQTVEREKELRVVTTIPITAYRR